MHISALTGFCREFNFVAKDLLPLLNMHLEQIGKPTLTTYELLTKCPVFLPNHPLLHYLNVNISDIQIPIVCPPEMMNSPVVAFTNQDFSKKISNADWDKIPFPHAKNFKKLFFEFSTAYSTASAEVKQLLKDKELSTREANLEKSAKTLHLLVLSNTFKKLLQQILSPVALVEEFPIEGVRHDNRIHVCTTAPLWNERFFTKLLVDAEVTKIDIAIINTNEILLTADQWLPFLDGLFTHSPTCCLAIIGNSSSFLYNLISSWHDLHFDPIGVSIHVMEFLDPSQPPTNIVTCTLNDGLAPMVFTNINKGLFATLDKLKSQFHTSGFLVDLSATEDFSCMHFGVTESMSTFSSTKAIHFNIFSDLLHNALENVKEMDVDDSPDLEETNT